MPSKSKSQQRLFGWVHSCQKGTSKNCPDNISKIANSISYGDAEDFARTKHKGLPNKIKTFKEFIEMKSFQEFRENEYDFKSMHPNLGRTTSNVRAAGNAFDRRVGGNYGKSPKQMLAYLVGEIESVINTDIGDAKDDEQLLRRLSVIITKLRSGVKRYGSEDTQQSMTV